MVLDVILLFILGTLLGNLVTMESKVLRLSQKGEVEEMARKKKKLVAKGARKQQFETQDWLNGILAQARILRFEKPAQARPTEEQQEMYQSDSGVPGTFVRNIPPGAETQWFATLVSGTTDHPSIQIRFKTSVIVVATSKGGFVYKNYKPGDRSYNTIGIVLHIASAGPLQMTEKQLKEFFQAIEEARSILEAIQKKQAEMASETP